jgi:hypothetical protein
MPTESKDDAADRKRLDAICEEVRVLLNKHEVGGVLLIGSRKSAAWQFVIPEWSTIETREHGLYLRLQSSKDDPSVLARTDATLSLAVALRDMAHDVHALFGRLYRSARMTMQQHGFQFEQGGFAPGEKRPDPEGGEGN